MESEESPGPGSDRIFGPVSEGPAIIPQEVVEQSGLGSHDLRGFEWPSGPGVQQVEEPQVDQQTAEPDPAEDQVALPRGKGAGVHEQVGWRFDRGLVPMDLGSKGSGCSLRTCLGLLPPGGVALQPEHIGVVGGGEVVAGNRRSPQSAPTVGFDVAIAEGEIAGAVVKVPGLVAHLPSGRLRLLEVPLQREGSVVDGLESFLEKGQGLGRRELDEVGEAAVGLCGRSLDARADEGVERDGAHPGHAGRPQGHLAGRRAFPQGGVLDVGGQEALPQEEGVRAVGPGKSEPTLHPGFAERDVLSVEIWWHEIGVVVGV